MSEVTITTSLRVTSDQAALGTQCPYFQWWLPRMLFIVMIWAWSARSVLLLSLLGMPGQDKWVWKLCPKESRMWSLVLFHSSNGSPRHVCCGYWPRTPELQLVRLEDCPGIYRWVLLLRIGTQLTSSERGSEKVHFIKWPQETLYQMFERRWESGDTKVVAFWHSENWQARRESGQGINTTSSRKSLTSIPQGLDSGSSIRSIAKLYEIIIDKYLTNTPVENNPLPVSIWMKRVIYFFLSRVTWSVDI